MIIEKKYHFYAAHRNQLADEKCGRIHGHTYDVVCAFQFHSINDNGITCLFSDIDKQIEPIIKEHCHWLLLENKDPLVDILLNVGEPIKVLPFITSAENLAKYFFNRIKIETKLPIFRIELSETKSSKVIYEIKSK